MQLRGRVCIRIAASAMRPSGLHSDAASEFGSAECGIKTANPCGRRVSIAVRRCYLAIAKGLKRFGYVAATRRQGMVVGQVCGVVPGQRAPYFGTTSVQANIVLGHFLSKKSCSI